MTTPDERAFFTYRRGQIRDEMLAFIRVGLRNLVNPDTEETFSEDEVRIATQPGSREYIRCDAIDLLGQSGQQRARFTAQQADPRKATSSWLRGFHVPLWLPSGPLPASSGSGPVNWTAPVGAIFIGSSTPGDPTAFQVSDPEGNLYQLFTTVTTPNTTIAPLTFFAVNGGAATNPKSGTIFSIAKNAPLGIAATGSATADFSGGFDAENDSDLASRVVDVMGRRPASGNNAMFRSWARAASVAIENAWVYATALNAGTVIVAITQKRGTVTGPLARIPSDVTIETLRTYLVPPGSPVVPSRPFVLPQKVVSDPISVGLTLSMRKNTTGGWADAIPWPYPIGTTPNELSRITTFTNSQDFRIKSGILLPNGVSTLTKPNAPSIMAWDATKSIFEKLDVLTITDLSGGEFHVTLDSAPAHVTLALNSVVSPYSPLAVAANGEDQGLIAQAAQQYFDALGPGELFDISADPRGSRAYRWPQTNEEAQSEAGQSMITQFIDSLGNALSNAAVIFMSHNVPAYPVSLSENGPSLLTLKDFGVYSS